MPVYEQVAPPQIHWTKPLDMSLEGQVYVCSLCGSYSDQGGFENHQQWHNKLYELQVMSQVHLNAINELRSSLSKSRHDIAQLESAVGFLRRQLDAVSERIGEVSSAAQAEIDRLKGADGE